MRPVIAGFVAVLAFLALQFWELSRTQWLNFAVLGVIAGLASRSRPLVVSFVAGFIVSILHVAALVAIHRAAAGEFDPVGDYLRLLWPGIAVQLALPPAGGAIGGLLRLGLARRLKRARPAEASEV